MMAKLCCVIMLCCVMLCHVMLRYVTLRYVTLSHVMSCHVMSLNDVLSNRHDWVVVSSRKCRFTSDNIP